MKFNEVNITGFGRLKNNFKLPLAKRINVILAPNDRGKSTLLEAIFAVLYSFGDVKSEEGRKKRLRYKPWNSDIYGGKLEFSLDTGEKYSIDKSISSSPREDVIGVFKQVKGAWQPVKVLKQDKYLGLMTGEHFLGIGRDVFEGLSIVRQFDVAALGERKKILDEIRSIIEMGKSGEGLLQALKKIQDRKLKIGSNEKKAKKTISGIKQTRLFDLQSEIKNIEDNFSKSKYLLLEKNKLEASLCAKQNELIQKIEPEIKDLKKYIAKGISYIKSVYGKTSEIIREMQLPELQNLRNYRNSLSEFKIRFENKSENIKKIKKSLKHNTVLSAVSLLFAVFFLVFSYFLNISDAKYVFLSFSVLLLIAGIYFLKVIRIEKKQIKESDQEKRNILQRFSAQARDLGIIIENSGKEEDVDFFEETWRLFLEGTGAGDLENLENVWHQSGKCSEILAKTNNLEIEDIEADSDFIFNIDLLNGKIEILRRRIFESEKLKDEINRIADNISIFEKQIESFSPQNNLAALNTERIILEEDIKAINIYRQGLDLTVELLKKAGRELYGEVTPYISEFINKYFKHLGADYDYVMVEQDLELKLKPHDYPEAVSIENIGKGMQTSLYLFLRLAIISLFKLNKNDSLPFILDETFNVLDDFSQNRQRRFLSFLMDVSFDFDIQCIYFTCQKYGQYIPIKSFLEEKGYVIREEIVDEFTILHGGKDESELGTLY